MTELSKILWKPKKGDKVISKHAFKKEFGYEIRGVIKGLMWSEAGSAGEKYQVLWFKEPLHSYHVGWFRKANP